MNESPKKFSNQILSKDEKVKGFFCCLSLFYHREFEKGITRPIRYSVFHYKYINY